MTWDEFKEQVEKKLAELGKDGNIKIGHFDFTSYEGAEPTIWLDQSGDLCIWD